VWRALVCAWLVLAACPHVPGELRRVGGTIDGLQGGGLVLQINGGGDISVPAGATTFQFDSLVAEGGFYTVTVLAQPASPTQTCSVTGGAGTAGAEDVATVDVTCATNQYTLGGTVSGLTSPGLLLQYNGGNDLVVAAGASTFTFENALASGTPYEVTVLAQPNNPIQICAVASGSGVITSADVSSVAVSCIAATPGTHFVRGTVAGLAGSGLVLRNNGTDDLAVPASATSFVFPASVVTGTTYAVTITAQPTLPSQTCAVSQSAGTMGAEDVTDVVVTCETNSYSIRGTVSGLTGSGLVLQNRYQDRVSVPANATSFTFPAGVLSGGTYDVSVASQPTSRPVLKCNVSNGAGTVGSADVTSVAVSCSIVTPRFVYVANDGSANISAYTVGGSGALTPIPGSPFATGVSPTSLALAPSGKFLYVASAGIYVYAINATTGALALIAGSPFGGSTSPKFIALHPSGRFAYVVASGIGSYALSRYSINMITGGLTYVGDDETFQGNTYPWGLSVDPSGRLVYLGNGHYVGGFIAFKIEPTTGKLSSVSGLGATYCSQAVVVPSGKYGYVPCSGVVEPFTIDVDTEALANISGSRPLSGAAAVAVAADKTGSFLYAATGTGNSLLAYQIDGATGTFSHFFSDPIAAGNNPVALEIDPSSHYLYVANQGGNNVSAYLLDLQFGGLSLINTYAAGTAPVALIITGTPP
jgi:6-phosphogluconolactonase (cycloisomerase 2 family)